MPGPGTPRPGAHRELAALLVVAILAFGGVQQAAAAPKWTMLIYMLADNDLECYGVSDLVVRGAWPFP
jgi:hypothetical protein